MAKSMSCDLIVPGCVFEVTGATEEEVLKHVAEHAKHAHGVNEVTPELLAKVKDAIRSEPDRR